MIERASTIQDQCKAALPSEAELSAISGAIRGTMRHAPEAQEQHGIWSEGARRSEGLCSRFS